MTHTEILNDVYHKCMELASNYSTDEDIVEGLSDEEREYLDIIVEKSEDRKAVLTVFITSMTHKIYNPNQDIRYHQVNLPNGYSGRVIDTREITPFMKKNRFPAMAETGWLTRTLEQNSPYMLDYPGQITPIELKNAFLRLLHFVEEGDKSPKDYLTYIFTKLILLRDRHDIELARPTKLSIKQIIDYLDKHFNSNYTSPGASRLPTLAIYSVYECMVEEVYRYRNKYLAPLQKHQSADSQSGSVGDIEVKNKSDHSVFEAVEIKHGIEITSQLIQDAYNKFMSEPIECYYILSTVGCKEDELDKIEEDIQRIRNMHNCQVIVNGVLDSLKYYLRLLNDTSKFINKYVNNMMNDSSIKFEHKQMWNSIVSL